MLKMSLVICIITFSMYVFAHNPKKISMRYISLPRFVDVMKNQSREHSKIDLVATLRASNINVVFMKKEDVFKEGFQDEKDDMDFVAFDDNSITVPIIIFKDIPLNEW